MPHRLRRLLSPHALIAESLQRQFHLATRPTCRMQRSRFQIIVRGTGLSREPAKRCIALADAMSAAARPLLAESHLMVVRRAAGFAIRVSFEDESVVQTGIVSTRVSYVATVGWGADMSRVMQSTETAF